jgi:hypothetical protein
MAGYPLIGAGGLKPLDWAKMRDRGQPEPIESIDE